MSSKLILRFAILLLSPSLTAAPLSAYEVIGHKWGMGPNVVTHLTGHEGTPGYVTWSVMAPGLPVFAGDLHFGGTTGDFGSLLGGSTLAEELDMLTAVFDTWTSVCGLTAVYVADGGAPGGASEASGAHLGDIRIGVIGGFGGPSELAHAFGPGTEAFFGIGGTLGGDAHFNSSKTWVDDEFDTTVDPDYDLHTVALHELGHSLGLDHSFVTGSVMAPAYEGGKRELTPDDIAGIQYIYGVPEPSTLVIIGGLAFIGLLRRKRADRRRGGQ